MPDFILVAGYVFAILAILVVLFLAVISFGIRNAYLRRGEIKNGVLYFSAYVAGIVAIIINVVLFFKGIPWRGFLASIFYITFWLALPNIIHYLRKKG